MLVMLCWLSGCTTREAQEAIPPTVALAVITQSTDETRVSQTPPSKEVEIIPSPTPTPLTHLVQAGETLLGIAIRYGVDVDDLLLVNPDVNPQFLSIGQALIIPGPEGEPISALVPSPTPVSLHFSSVRCFETSTGGLWCVAGVESANSAVEAVTGVMTLFSAGGTILRAVPVHTPLRALQAHQQQPLAAYFEPSVPDFQSAQLTITGAIQVEEPNTRYQNLTVKLEQSAMGEQGRRWRVEGHISGWEAGELGKISILFLALDEGQEIIGFRAMEIGEEELMYDRYEFNTLIYSWEPEIHDVAIYAEGILVP